jgi:transposase-like protein
MKNRSSGIRLTDGTVVLSGDPRSTRMHCMSCHGEAHEVPKPNGQKVFRCTTCGREWTSSKM